MGPISCAETSLTNYHPTPRNVSGERRQLYRGGSPILANREVFIPVENRVPDVRPVTSLPVEWVTSDFRNKNVVEGLLSTCHVLVLKLMLAQSGRKFRVIYGRRGSSKVFTRAHILRQMNPAYTGLFISPSGIFELDCPTTKTDTAERSISIGRESLQVFFCTRDLGVLPGSTARG